jgi:hypothetical protein
MIAAYDFRTYVETAGKHRRLLARVYLNVMYDSGRYPVDVSEIEALPPIPRVVAFAFLDGMASVPNTIKHLSTNVPDKDFFYIRNTPQLITWAEQKETTP